MARRRKLVKTITINLRVGTFAFSTGAQLNRNGKTLFSVQYLRALAAILVVYQHSTEQIPGLRAPVPTIGMAGVDLFFVISGFIMITITYSRPVGAGEFALRRIARIVPIYWFYTTLTAAAILLAPMFFRDSQFTIPHYILSLLFVPHRDPGDFSLSPLLKLGWTLNYEMFFYLVFSSTLLMAPRLRIPGLIAIFIALVATGWLIRPRAPILAVYTNPIVLEFAFGALVGYAFVTGRLFQIGHKTAWVLIASGSVVGFMLSPYFGIVDRVIIYGLPAALVLSGCAALEATGGVSKRPLLRLVGDSSYSIYLAHLYGVVFLLRFAWPRLGLGILGIWWVAFVSVGIASAVAVGVLSYLFLERPLNCMGHRLIGRWLASKERSGFRRDKVLHETVDNPG